MTAMYKQQKVMKMCQESQANIFLDAETFQKFTKKLERKSVKTFSETFQ